MGLSIQKLLTDRASHHCATTDVTPNRIRNKGIDFIRVIESMKGTTPTSPCAYSDESFASRDNISVEEK